MVTVWKVVAMQPTCKTRTSGDDSLNPGRRVGTLGHITSGVSWNKTTLRGYRGAFWSFCSVIHSLSHKSNLGLRGSEAQPCELFSRDPTHHSIVYYLLRSNCLAFLTTPKPCCA